MSKEMLAYISIDLLIEGLSNILNIPKNKLQEYYDDSRQFRDYLNSLIDNIRLEAKDDLLNLTPSTTPRFDIPWMTEELKKKQDDLFKIKNQITEIQTKARQTENTTYHQAIEGAVDWLGQPILNAGAKAFATLTKPIFNKGFEKRKKEKVQEYNKQSAELTNKAEKIAKAPLVNKNPTYQSIQERRRNALPKQKAQIHNVKGQK